MCAKLCVMNQFCHKQLRETGSGTIIRVVFGFASLLLISEFSFEFSLKCGHFCY